jgi:hypothetical protein
MSVVRSFRVAPLLAALTVTMVACVGTTMSRDTSSANRSIVIQQRDAGKTIEARPGERLEFQLMRQIAWKVQSFPSSLHLLVRPTHGHFVFLAERSGSGTIKATGSIPCPRLEVCPGVDVSFSVTVRVH